MVLDVPAASEVDGLRRAVDDPALGRMAPHITLVPPVNVRTADLGAALARLCGLRGIESHEPPGFGAALRRWLVYGVLGLIAIGVLNVLWCLFDRPWRQCWHDKAAGTFVAAS